MLNQNIWWDISSTNPPNAVAYEGIELKDVKSYIRSNIINKQNIVGNFWRNSQLLYTTQVQYQEDLIYKR